MVLLVLRSNGLIDARVSRTLLTSSSVKKVIIPSVEKLVTTFSKSPSEGRAGKDDDLLVFLVQNLSLAGCEPFFVPCCVKVFVDL